MSRPPLLAVPVSVTVLRDYHELCEHVAFSIAHLVRDKPDAVLGLATGSTPLGVYDLLAQWHRKEGLDFSHVTCFNLDEYYPMLPEAAHSYHRFMQESLFSRINCRYWSIPDGHPRNEQEIARDCQRYEARIAEAGGIDLQLLGIGRSGHIGFNEPGSAPDSRTRLVTLHPITRQDAVDSFGALQNVPQKAITMGISTILEARQIVLMASGSSKASIIASAFSGDVNEDIPAAWVRTHPNACLCFDREAGRLLTEMKP